LVVQAEFSNVNVAAYSDSGAVVDITTTKNGVQVIQWGEILCTFALLWGRPIGRVIRVACPSVRPSVRVGPFRLSRAGP